MNEIFNKISDLLKQEDFQYDYDHYFMEDGLHISLNKDIKKNSLYHWDFLGQDDCCCDKEACDSDDEQVKFDKHREENNLWECIEIRHNSFNDTYWVEVYNNIHTGFTLDENFSGYRNNKILTIKSLDALLHFTKSYVIPTIHKIETCTEFLKDNHHFVHKTLKGEKFGENFISQVRSNRIEMFEETKK